MGQTIINRTQATSNHDGLVISPAQTTRALLKTAEITQQVGPSKLIVKRRPTQWPFNHDLQWRSDSIRCAVVIRFPRRHGIIKAQM